MADVAAYIDHENLIGQVDFPKMHVVEHLLHAVRPYLVVARMAEQTHADDYATLEREAFLHLKELFFESRTATKRDNLVAFNHSAAFFTSVGLQCWKNLRVFSWSYPSPCSSSPES